MLCQLCKKDVPEENFQIHEVNCIKNNVKCEKCEEIVPKSSYEEHFESLHQLKKCINCEVEFEARFLASHHCSNPDQTCKYCEAVMKTSLFAEHVVGCENQTEECDRCQKFIRKKDLEGHKKSNCGLAQMNIPPPPALPNALLSYQNLFNPNSSSESFAKLLQSGLNNQPQFPILNYNPLNLNNPFHIPLFNNPNVPAINDPAINDPVIIDNPLDNLKNYTDNGGINYKIGLTILKGPVASFIRRPMLKPTYRFLISTPQDYNDFNKAKK